MEVLEQQALLSSSNVDVTLDTRYGENCMYFAFKGKFSTEASKLATKAWIEEFESNPTRKYTHLWDCTKMDDFDFDAKNDWMKALSNYSHQIEYITVVSNSVLIRGAARVMSKFSKLDLRIFKALEELDVNNSH